MPTAIYGGVRCFSRNSRPLRLRPGLDPAHLRELDDDLEIAEFLRKSARGLIAKKRSEH